MALDNRKPLIQVAILLISFTIVVVGTVYERATNASMDQSEITIAAISSSSLPAFEQTTTPTTLLFSQLTQSLTDSLANVRQFLGLEIKTTPPVTSNSLPLTSIDETPITEESPTPFESEKTSPPTNFMTTIKNITGYSKWEKFKENFRTSQEKYAGTGECMITVRGLGCLVEW